MTTENYAKGTMEKTVAEKAGMGLLRKTMLLAEPVRKKNARRPNLEVATDVGPHRGSFRPGGGTRVKSPKEKGHVLLPQAAQDTGKDGCPISSCGVVGNGVL